MIDLHNHILPGVDDGSANMEESIEIARQFVAEGVTAVAATPHLDPLNDRGIEAPEVRERVRALREALAEAHVPLEVHPGSELYLTPEADELVAADRVCLLGSGKYVLVEAAVTIPSKPLYLKDTIYRLQLKGYRPILAHPERYGWVQASPQVLDEYIEGGVALQLTAPSLLGEYGASVKRTSEKLLARNAYSLAASDRHHPGPGRSLASAHERIAQLCDVETADLLLRENPGRVLAGNSLQLPECSRQASEWFFSRLVRRLSG